MCTVLPCPTCARRAIFRSSSPSPAGCSARHFLPQCALNTTTTKTHTDTHILRAFAREPHPDAHTLTSVRRCGVDKRATPSAPAVAYALAWNVCFDVAALSPPDATPIVTFMCWHYLSVPLSLPRCIASLSHTSEHTHTTTVHVSSARVENSSDCACAAVLTRTPTRTHNNNKNTHTHDNEKRILLMLVEYRLIVLMLGEDAGRGHCKQHAHPVRVSFLFHFQVANRRRTFVRSWCSLKPVKMVSCECGCVGHLCAISLMCVRPWERIFQWHIAVF